MKPSVTQLINLLDKPALMRWANNIGLQGIRLDEYRKKSMSAGSSLHKQIENYFNDNIPFNDEIFFKNFLEFMKDKELIDAEQKVETDYFTGRYDIRLKFNNYIYICDFKSNQKNIYFENKLQLISYQMATKCDRLAIVSIPDFRFLEVNVPDTKPYEQIIINLSSIYSFKQELENSMNSYPAKYKTY